MDEEQYRASCFKLFPVIPRIFFAIIVILISFWPQFDHIKKHMQWPNAYIMCYPVSIHGNRFKTSRYCTICHSIVTLDALIQSCTYRTYRTHFLTFHFIMFIQYNGSRLKCGQIVVNPVALKTTEKSNISFH